MRWLRVTAACAAVVAVGSGCATRLDACRARFIDPSYVVTEHFYKEVPQRVAVLPFATRSGKKSDEANAELCRRVFYQHLSLRDFDDLKLRKFDTSVLYQDGARKQGAIHELFDVIKALDIVGMTSLVDIPSLFSNDEIKHAEFYDMIRVAREDMKADAYVVGITRSYGRFYAVLISSIGISTRVEMRSSATGSLLWRGEATRRNYEVPLSLNPFDIPKLLFNVWRNSRGQAMDVLAYAVYRDLCMTIPFLPASRDVSVQILRNYTPAFNKPTLWMMFPRERVNKGDRLTFHMEENGWYQCTDASSNLVWIFRGDGKLVDQDGAAIDPRADEKW